MEIKYILQTISGDAINVTRETFMDYLSILDNSYPEYEVKTFDYDLGHCTLTQRAYFIFKDGERKVACQMDTWEESKNE